MERWDQLEGNDFRHNSESEEYNADSMVLDRRHHWLGLHRDSSRITTSYRFHIRSRLLQASSRFHFREHHRQQERMGLWLLKIHHTMGNQKWLCAANHDQYVSDGDMVSLRDNLLVLRKAI